MLTHSADEIASRIEKSGLLSRNQIDSCYDELDDPTPEKLLSALVRTGHLTRFQAVQLTRGRFSGFLLSGRYKILDSLGDGGMGYVLLCEHLVLQRLAAVKVLHPDQSATQESARRLVHESRLAAQLDHPNIARVFDAESDPSTFVAYEFVDGVDLHHLVAERGPLSMSRAASFVYQAACGLAAAHEAGVIHRDIKPGNLMVDRRGQVKIIDFGLAAGASGSFDPESERLVTLEFASPEQLTGNAIVDARTDLYSLGCTLLFLLTGKLPFECDADRRKRTPVDLTPRLREIPAEFRAVIDRMTSDRVADRFQTATEAMLALAPFCPTALTSCDEPAIPQRAPAEYRLGVTPAPVARPKPMLPAPVRTSRDTPSPMAPLRLDSKIYERMSSFAEPAPTVDAAADTRTEPMRPMAPSRFWQFGLVGLGSFVAGFLASAIVWLGQ